MKWFLWLWVYGVCYISLMDASCTDLSVIERCSQKLTGPQMWFKEKIDHNTKERPEKCINYKFRGEMLQIKCC